MKKKKCYIYTRVSTAAQTEGYSLDAQKERLRQFAEYKDLEIAGEYCDAGRSGHSIKGRPSFMEMLDDITAEKDSISFVLVYKLSRFGRNAADVLKSMQLLMDYDVDLVCVEDSIDSSTQGGRLTLAILSAVAEIERENINVQFMVGKMQKILDGGWSGGPLPYGYRNVNKQPEVIPSEAEIVKIIYEMYLQPDTGYATIARWLNDHGYTRMVRNEEKPFTAGFIKNVLRNPFYCGRLCYNRRTNSEKIRKNPKTAICIQGKHQAIISEDVWDSVEAKINESPGKNENTTDPERISLLSGLVKCPACGNGLVAMKNRKINRNHGGHYKVIYYYACRYHRKAEGRTCSFRHTYNQEKLDGAVLEIVGQIASTKEFRDAFSNAVGSKKSVDEIEAELKSLRKSLHSEEHKKYKLGEDLDHLDVLSDDYETEYEAIMARIDEIYDSIYELQEQINKKRERLKALRNGVDSSDNIRLILDNFDRLIRSMNYEERREMCRLFIQRIDVFPEEQEDGRILRQIVFKIPVYYNLASDAGGKDDPDDEVTFAVDCTQFQATVSESKATYFEAVVAISEDMEKAKALGATAREKAEAVQTGFWKSKAKAVEDLKDATITTADTTLATLDIVDKVSENQKKMADACNEFIKLGAVDLATNRAVIAFIEKTMAGGADKTLGEETVSQLQGVIRDLKQKSDLLVKQRKQGAKINEHETRLVQVEAHANDLDSEIEKSRESEKKHDSAIKEQREKGEERDRRLDAGDERDDTQDKQIQDLHQKNVEQDERLQHGDEYDKKQDERLKQGEEKDIEQDAVLEEQKQKDVEHDKTLAELEDRIKVLENDLEIVKNSKRTQLYIAISAGIGLIGVILGIIALVI